MKFARNRTLPLLLALAAAGLMPGMAAAQSDVKIKMTWPNAGGSTCVFTTDAHGWHINESDSNSVVSVGTFDTTPGSGCPTGGGGGTNQPIGNFVLAANPAGPFNLDDQVADKTTITWSAPGADACRMVGSAPAGAPAIPGWSIGSYACADETSCSATHTVPTTGGQYTFTKAGDYKFQLKCVDRASLATEVSSQELVVKVTGGGGTPPPDDNCVAPPGWTRQTSGNISLPSGSYPKANQPLETWEQTFGWDLAANTHWTWPGGLYNKLKFNIKANHYLALWFRVPHDYPVYEGAPAYAPYGSFTTNDSWVDYTTYSFSISPVCGDFDKASAPADRKACYVEFTPFTMPNNTWVVQDLGDYIAGRCNLRHDTDYYLNIAPRALDNPANTCTSTVCRVNLKNMGTTMGTYDPVGE